MGFVRVASVEEIQPGTALGVAVGRDEIGIFNIDGEFYAIDNRCPHADGPLSEGYIQGENVSCPWHAWLFSVKTGKMVHNEFVCQRSYPCKVEDGAVLVEL